MILLLILAIAWLLVAGVLALAIGNAVSNHDEEPH